MNSDRLMLALIAAASTTVACSGATRASRADDATPELFAPGVVSTALPEFALSFTPDGRTVFFNRMSADRSRLTIMMSERSGNSWSEPVVAPFSGTHRDVDPFVSPDGSRIYFSSDRPRAAPHPRSLSTWYVDRTPTGWSDPIDGGEPLNSDSADVFVSAARDGTLIFSSNRDGRRRVYSTRYSNSRWETPTPISFGAVVDAGNVLLAPSGRFAVLAMERAGRKADLFVSCRAGSSWGEPHPLSDEVNSKYADFAPAIDAAETTLYFTSERPGIVGALPDSVRPPGDIYRIAARRAGIDC